MARTGLLWCAFLPSIHPSTFSHILYTLDQSLMPEKRISSLASSPSDDQNACHAFLLHLNSNVRVPLERIYCWVATSRSATVPYTLCSARIPQRASKGFVWRFDKKAFHSPKCILWSTLEFHSGSSPSPPPPSAVLLNLLLKRWGSEKMLQVSRSFLCGGSVFGGGSF